MPDRIDILKQDGSAFTGIKAAVEQGKVHLNFVDGLIILSGDLIRRKMSNGGEEIFEVIDPIFYEKFYDIPAHYELIVRRMGSQEGLQPQQNITYNISGPNARISQNSTDKSLNIALGDSRIDSLLSELRKGLEEAGLGDVECQNALEIVDEIEVQFSSGSAKEVVVKALLDSLPAITAISNLGTAILGHISRVQ